ncbi:hypothetical protein BGZ51_009693 [Haplosporangium sp. Z 767]|nr:hypothetical protein BGZ51_009693 [Haplosporangium sp. Z 767]
MDHGYFQPASPTSPQPPNAKMVAFRDENYVLPPPPRQPTLFGVRCSEISQRAYTGKSSEMKKSFDRLQRLDNGKVEYRTIAFCTHLTVSRWEPSIPSQSTSSSADSTTSERNTNPIPQQKNDPARLMSLANYIRHVLSLTAGVPSPQPQPIAQIPQRQVHDNSQANASPAKDTSAEDTSSAGSSFFHCAAFRMLTDSHLVCLLCSRFAQVQGLSKLNQTDDIAIHLTIMIIQDDDMRDNSSETSQK